MCAAGPLDIPAAAPPKFRPLVRAGLRSGKHTSHTSHHAWESRFTLKTRQGYEVTVVAVRGIVALEVARPRSGASASLKRGRALTAYVAHGTVTPRRIKATFAGLGRVSMRFHPSGRVARPSRRRHCNGAGRFIRRFGVFAGTVRFTGEGHYVAVRAHRAKGLIRRRIHPDCGARNFDRGVGRLSRPVRHLPEFMPTILAASWRHVVSSVDFFALQIRKKTLYLAVSEESRGSMAEVRYALAVAPSKTFVFDNALTSATLRPPAPFHGKGSYSAAPDGTKAWAGSLSVSFPGAPRFPLAGTQFAGMLATGF
jgi:hypothetical protein